MAKSNLEIQINAKDNASGVFRNINASLKDFSNQARKVSLGMMAVGGAIVGMGIAAIKTYTDMGSEIYDLSKKTGMGTRALSELRYMAEQCGTSLGGLEVGIKRMQSVLYDASNGLGAATSSLAALNLTVGELQGLAPEEQFWTIASALSDVEDPSLRAALAVDLFGRSGTDLLPILDEGATGIQEMKDRAAELGVVFDEEAAAKADKLGDRLNDLKTALTGAAVELGETLMPYVMAFADWLVKVIKGVTDWIDEHPAMVRAILAIGAALVTAGIALKAFTVGLALAQALSGPVGWALLAGAAVAAGAAYIMIDQMMNIPSGTSAGGGAAARPPRPSEAPAPDYHWYWDGNAWNQVPNMQHGGIVPGPIGQPVPIIAHGGEQFAGVGNSLGGDINVYVQGSVVTERELADRLRELFLLKKDQNTTTGF